MQASVVLKPDVIITDIALFGMKSESALHQLAANCLHTKIIFSWHHDQRRTVIEVIDAGCAGCIVHEANPVEYGIAVLRVMKGRAYVKCPKSIIIHLQSSIWINQIALEC